MKDFIDLLNVTILHVTPAQLRALLENPEQRYEHVRQIICSADSPPPGELAGSCRKCFPNASVCYVCGAHEAAVEVTVCDESEMEHCFDVQAGAPADNMQVYILDEYGRLQPVGVPGTMYVAGDGLPRGYLNRPELSKEQFVTNPFEPGSRIFNTGRWARWLDDGTLQYVSATTGTPVSGERSTESDQWQSLVPDGILERVTF
jgi:non-ribosomal peptide synthetase component F